MRIVDNVKNILLAYGPIIGPDRENKREIKRAINLIKRDKKDFYNPINDNLKLEFFKSINNMATICYKLRKLYNNNLNGSEEDLDLFLRSNINMVLDKNSYDLDSFELKNIHRELIEQGSGGIKSIDYNFKLRSKAFNDKDFKMCNKYLNKNMVLADLALFDFDTIIGAFKFKSNGGLYTTTGESIYKSILDLYYLTGFITEFERIVVDPIMAHCLSYSKVTETYNYEDLSKDVYELYHILENLLTNKFLEDLIGLIDKDFQTPPPIKAFQNNFPKDIFDKVYDKFRIDRQHFIQQEKDKMLKVRIQQLFGDAELNTCQVYNHTNSNLFFEAGLHSFKYIEAVKIIKTFYLLYFNDNIAKILMQFKVNTEYYEEEKQSSFNDCFESLKQIFQDISKFEEDLTIPAFSKIDPYLRIIKTTILDGKSKLKAEEAIRFVNNQAKEIFQSLFVSATRMNAITTAISVDITAVRPKFLSNVSTLLTKHPSICNELEDCSDKFNKLVHLLRAFKVSLDI